MAPRSARTSQSSRLFLGADKGPDTPSRVIQFENVKTPAQAQSPAGLLENVDIPSLAQALGMTPQELVAAWSWDVIDRPTLP